MNSCRIAASKKIQEVERFNKVPTKKLPFIEFEVGDKFFRKVQPAAMYKHFTDLEKTKGKEDKKGQKISVNFEYKWVGPFTVTKKFSPVLYESIINKEPTVIHAINMKTI